MPRPLRITVLLVVAGVLLCAEPSPAAGKKKTAAKADAALGAVGKVLRAETAGQVDRRGELAGALQEHPESAAARWQAGFVRDGAAWRSFDVPSEANAKVELLEHYR